MEALSPDPLRFKFIDEHLPKWTFALFLEPIQTLLHSGLIMALPIELGQVKQYLFLVNTLGKRLQ